MPPRGLRPLETPGQGAPPLAIPNRISHFMSMFEIIDMFHYSPPPHLGLSTIISKYTISCEKKPFYIRCIVHSMKFYYHVVKKILQGFFKFKAHASLALQTEAW